MVERVALDISKLWVLSMLVGRAVAVRLPPLSVHHIIELCVFCLCESVCESVCVCMNKYIVTVVIVYLLSFYSLQRVVEVVGMIREVCDSWQNPNRRCLAQQNSSRLATLIYSFFLLLLGAVRPPNGRGKCAFGGERKRNELIAVCTCEHEERERSVALSSLPEQFLE